MYNLGKVIIGITGTYGAGKEIVVNYLVEKRGFIHFSVRKFLMEKLKEENLPPTRKNLIDIGNRLRKENGASFLVRELYKKASKIGKDCVIESLRNPKEILFLRRKKDFCLFAIDADIKIRYERTKTRGETRDVLSFSEFVKSERSEMKSSDPNKINLEKCISMAVFKFENNGTIKELYQKVEKALATFKG